MIHISVQLREHHPNYGYLLTYDVETNTLDEIAGLPEHLIQCYPFIQLGGDNHSKRFVKVSFPRTHCDDPSQGSSLTAVQPAH